MSSRLGDPFKYGLGLQFDDLGNGSTFEDSNQLGSNSFGNNQRESFSGLGNGLGFGSSFGSSFGNGSFSGGLTSLSPLADPMLGRNNGAPRLSSSPIGERAQSNPSSAPRDNTFVSNSSSLGGGSRSFASSSPSSSLSNIWESPLPAAPVAQSSTPPTSHMNNIFGTANPFSLGGSSLPGTNVANTEEQSSSWSMKSLHRTLDELGPQATNHAARTSYDAYQPGVSAAALDQDDMFRMDMDASLGGHSGSGLHHPSSYGLSSSFSREPVAYPPHNGGASSFGATNPGSYPGGYSQGFQSSSYGAHSQGSSYAASPPPFGPPSGPGSLPGSQTAAPEGFGPPPFGEHPLGEHPSRTLFVRNINSNVEDEDLSNLFEQYGPIRTMYTQCKHRGFVMISYYDIRHAKNAMRYLQGKVLRRRKLDIHYSIPKDNPSEKDQNQGTLVVFNLDPATTNEELKAIFGAHGEIKEVRETPNKKHHKFIEFFDIRDADKAMKALNKTEIKGKKIKIEPSRPGGARKTMMNQMTLDQQYLGDGADPSMMDPALLAATSLPYSEMHQDPTSNNVLLSGPYSPSNHSYPPPQQVLPKYVSAAPGTSPLALSPPTGMQQQQQMYQQQGSLYNRNPRSSSAPFENNASTSPPTSIMGNGSSYSVSKSPSSSSLSSVWSMMPNGSGLMGSEIREPVSPRTYSPAPGPIGLEARRGSFGSGTPLDITPSTTPPRDRSPEPRRHRSQSIEDDKSRYILHLDRVRNGEDTRTTLMIKNIPNKYNQKMLLATVDERHRGLYDFFYLPIDFKNKCNVGYAFINFISHVHIPAFYEEFNNKKWEKFNSEKVCEITFARIQGKNSLISHFQNSSLMCEDKKCRPIIFHSEGPNAGEMEPFPVGLSPRRRSHSNSSKDDERENSRER